MVILSSTYFGPVQWYQKLCRHGHVAIERYDHFMKQTYRNRCVIAAANGPQALTVPVEKGETQPLLMKDVRISDHGNWRHQHWNALVTAYSDSPFFEFYEDDIRPFFTEKWEFLYDFNEAIRQTMCALIDIRPDVAYTTSYEAEAENDFRATICPKHPAPDPDFQPRPYYQIYAQKHGFIANLSVLDLLFNMGPESIFYL